MGEQIKDEIRRRGYDVACRLLGAPARVNGKHSEWCVPWRPDTHPSLHVYHDDGAWTDRGRGDKGDIFDLVARVKGLDARGEFRQVLAMAAGAIGLRLPEAASTARTTRVERPTAEDLERLAKRYGLAWADFERQGCTVEPWRFNVGNKAEAVWIEAWAVVYPVLTAKGAAEGKKAKSVERLQQRPDGSTKRLAIHGKGGGGVFPPAQARGTGPLVVAGGEEKALAAIAAGFRAVCPTTGEGKVTAALARTLVEWGNREFVVVMDADAAGEAGAQGTAARLLEQGATTVRTVVWPSDRPKAHDLSDELVAGGVSAVRAVVVAATPFLRAAATDTFNMTDLGNAERLLAEHGQDVCYAYALNAWHVWDGRRWQRDDGAKIGRLAAGVARKIYDAAAKCTDPDKRQALVKWGVQSEGARKIASMVELARPHAAVDIGEFDQGVWRLNVANGTLDLRTCDLTPHRREDRITKMVPVEYDPAGRCPLWMGFLERIMDGNHGLIQFLQRAVGYSLTGDTSEQCMLLLYGTGRNGKSTFLETLKFILGDYARQADPSSFMVSRNEGRGPREDLVQLRGARFVPAVEAEATHRLAEATLKNLTGGDTVSVRGLYERQQEFRPQFKLWLATNYKPDIRGRDMGIWRRIRLVPFQVAIPEAECDRQLPEKLQKEAAGILNWAVEGCQAWLERGLRTPPEVESATHDYQEETDILGGWISEKCRMKPYFCATLSALYGSYREYAEACGERPDTAKGLSKMLQERGYKKRKGALGTTEFIGIALKDEDND